MKARISFDLDLSDFPDSYNVDKVREVITKHLIGAARARHVSALHSIRKDDSLDMDVKAIRMAEGIIGMKLTLMAEANLEIAPLAQDAPVSNVLPFERP